MEELTMPGRGSRFTKKEDRQIEHIKDSEQESGRSKEESERIAYATVNKQKQERKTDKKDKK
jgi:hypothetical protein